MVLNIGALAPQELVVLLVALGGVVPILAYRHEVPWWVLLPFVFLLIGAISTNLEHLVWPPVINAIEHPVGNMGSGVAMAVTACVGHRQLAATPATHERP